MPADPEPPPPQSSSTPWTTTLYHSLHELAARQLRQDRSSSLQPTLVVHEAWLRIARLHGEHGTLRAQFFALAGKTMRSVVVDHARRRLAQKRGQGQRADAAIDVETLASGRLPADENVLALGEALQRLEHEDPELLEVVDRMFFGGQTAAEAAVDLGVSSRTVERRWRFARAWLHAALGGEQEPN